MSKPQNPKTPKPLVLKNEYIKLINPHKIHDFTLGFEVKSDFLVSSSIEISSGAKL